LADRSAATPAPKGTPDDFKLIKGIGPAIEDRLHSAGIFTFAQLADRSPAEIAELIPSLSAKRVARQGLIRQAHKLALKGTRVRADKKATASPGRQRYATFTVELLLDEGNLVRRTRVVHVQDGDEAVWAGWKDPQLLSFFIEHAELRLAEPAPTPIETVKPVAASADHAVSPETPRDLAGNNLEVPVETGVTEAQMAPLTNAHAGLESKADLQLEVGNIQLDEVSGERSGSGPPYVKHLRARINFKLSGVVANQSAAYPMRCFTQILACELTTGQTNVLTADQQHLHSNLSGYQATLTFPLPEVGRYQLLGMILIPDHNMAAVALGPILRVVP